jgi:hypothetical protein
VDCEKTRPLTIEEARERVREAALRASPREWIRQNPLEALAGAFLAGLSAGAGKSPTSGKLQSSLDILFRFLSD